MLQARLAPKSQTSYSRTCSSRALTLLYTYSMFKKYKPFLKPFLIIFAFYCVSMLAIWRSGVSFIDDNGRAFTGKGWTSDFNRYSSSILSFFLIQLNTSLVDISPWSQIVAMAFLAAASLLIVYYFGDVKKKLHLILSLLVGLTPFTLVCWLYKFDAPCMAMALLTSVTPFLFIKEKADKKNLIKFSVASTIGLFITLTSYQAFSGVYLLILLAFILKYLLGGKKLQSLLAYLGCGLGGFLVACIAFKLLPEPSGYRSIETLSLIELIPGIFQNIANIYAQIFTSFAPVWRIFTALNLICAIIAIFINAKGKIKQKILSTIAFILFIILAVPFSYGIYLLLAEAPTNPRSLIGVGSALAIALIITTNGFTKKQNIYAKIALTAPAVILVYLFFIYSFTIGNALADQYEYSSNINAAVADSIAQTYNREELATKKLIIHGDIGLVPNVQHVNELYPITAQIIDEFQTGLSYTAWGSWRLRFNYGLEYDHYSLLEQDIDCTSGTVKYDGYYNTVVEDGDKVCIEIK